MTGLPFTNPRHLASLQPDREPDREPEEQPVTHWWASENTLTWSDPITVIACGAETDRAIHDVNRVTCAECLEVVVRRRCLALEDGPGPLRGRCGMTPHEGLHEWEADRAKPADPRRRAVQREAAESFATSARREVESRRQAEEVRLAALGLAESDEEETPSDRLNFKHRVLGRWTA
jgi:hypothetical protein